MKSKKPAPLFVAISAVLSVALSTIPQASLAQTVARPVLVPATISGAAASAPGVSAVAALQALAPTSSLSPAVAPLPAAAVPALVAAPLDGASLVAPRQVFSPAAPAAAPVSPARAAVESAAAQPAAVFDGVKSAAARRDESVVDDYFGTPVADPYRWMEDPNSAETKAAVKAQDDYARSYLKNLPGRNAIAKQLASLMNYDKYETPHKVGGYWIYSKKTGLRNQAVLYKSKKLYSKPTVLLDPNPLASDGTAALAGTSFSKDGRLMAYAISRMGSDWKEWKIRDVRTGQDLPETLRWTKFTGLDWAADGSGFYYTRYPEPKPGETYTAATNNPKSYFHRLNTPQEQDQLIYERPDHPDWELGVSIDGKSLTIEEHYKDEGPDLKYRLLSKDLTKPDAKFETILDGLNEEDSIIDDDGDRLYVQTTRDAPRGRLVVIDRRHPDPKDWKDVIPQAAGRAVLQSVQKTKDGFAAVWIEDVHHTVKIYGPRGGFLREIKLPGLGTVSGFSGKYLKFESFAHPTTVYHVNSKTGRLRAFHRPKVAFDPKKIEATQVFYASKDGTKIPMWIVHKKGLKLNGQNPTYLYAYGGFNVSSMPDFKPENLAWLEMGGVYAVPNLRGGGEYGDEWHDAGRLQNKQNVFDDFIAAAEYLIREGYTSTPKLAIGGRSNGGLLVGAALTQRPDLFGAAIPQVGVQDMLRFQRFTGGASWEADYGSSGTEDGFKTLIKYSPLHNVKPGTVYPPTLVMTGDHDDRVVPSHSHKFAATLQAAQAGPAPVIERVEANAGHHPDHDTGLPTGKWLEKYADTWAFLKKALGIP